MSLADKIEIICMTHTGMKRGHNEDSVGSRPAIGLAVLADGMGGYNAGEVASAMAVNTIIDSIEQELADCAVGQIDAASGFTEETLLVSQVIEKANQVINNTANSQPQYNGMGTTVVTALFYNNKISIAHVGDSRLYRLRNNQLESITADHTLLRELIEWGFYTEEEARQSANKNLVTRALGINSNVNIDIQEDLALPEDIYLMCSDGLNDMVTDGDICLILQSNNDNLENAAKALIDKANENGGYDNVSVILARPLEAFPANQKCLETVVDWFF